MTGLAGTHLQQDDRVRLTSSVNSGKGQPHSDPNEPRRKSSLEALTYRQLILYMGFQHVLISMVGSLLFFVWGITYIGVALMGWEITCGVLFFIGYGVLQILPLETYGSSVSKTVERLLNVFVLVTMLSVLLATGTMTYGIFIASTITSSNQTSLEADITFAAGLYAALLGVTILAAKVFLLKKLIEYLIVLRIANAMPSQNLTDQHKIAVSTAAQK
ncbi:uncharacterized protein LOC129589178 [Paramacrobiotus metropolitanus]|uniref:uncharacterized protein LOC129589178 n=1 Tax=Paramacrobiotus metropolitanus TaxID=2943436 RepID=UPI002445C953|nr:uncharacterized protein LOC129589178 [Paramacrobiotus metropolitanus]